MVEQEGIEQGDTIDITFDPQVGHEQKGRRPALVVSNNSFNHYSNLVIVCPITNTDRGNPFHVKLDCRTKTTGVILTDHIKALDVYTRKYKYIEKLPNDILFNVLNLVGGFVEYNQ